MTTTDATRGRRGAIWACAVGLAALACAPGVSATRTPLPAQTAAPADSCNLTAPGRIVAVGDVHGAFDRFLAILREAGVIDSNRRWVGGNTTLVQVGDLVDRGDDSRRVLDFVRQLEGDAPRAGGQVRLALGNHEVMRMAGDWRYVTDGEYEAFKSADAAALRERLVDQLLAAKQDAARKTGQKLDAREERKALLAKTPPGAAEMQMAFSDTGEYGRWLRTHDIMLRIGGIVFVHGGSALPFASHGCAGLNTEARAAMRVLDLTDPKILDNLLWSPDGPLWNRSLVGVAPAATSDDVTAVLKALGASRIVVGHTASTPGAVRSLHDGRVLAIDAGMLGGRYFPEGRAAALEIQGGTYTAIYEGKREVLISPGGSGSTRR